MGAACAHPSSHGSVGGAVRAGRAGGFSAQCGSVRTLPSGECSRSEEPPSACATSSARVPDSTSWMHEQGCQPPGDSQSFLELLSGAAAIAESRVTTVGMLIELLIEYRRRGGWNPRPSLAEGGRVPTSIADLGGAEQRERGW